VSPYRVLVLVCCVFFLVDKFKKFWTPLLARHSNSANSVGEASPLTMAARRSFFVSQSTDTDKQERKIV
jgi:hypothetical protein